MRSIIRLCLAVTLLLSVPMAVLADPVPAGSQASPVGFLRLATNDVYVFGTARCTTSELVTVRAVVLQGALERAGEVTVKCGPTPRFWIVRIANDGTGGYVPGPATLAIGFSAGSGVHGREQPIYLVGI